MFNVIFISTSKKRAIVLLNFNSTAMNRDICNAHQYKLVGER